MSANLAATVLPLLAAVMLAAAAACSDDPPDPDAAAQSDAGSPQGNASDPADRAAAPAQTAVVDILQSDNRFITIALSRYRSSVSDIDPDALNPWCTHPDAENIVVPPQQRTFPPVPAYLPQGVSLHNQITHPDGRYYGDTYVSGDGNGDHIRLRVLHSTCLITNSDPALIEQVDVGGNWGVFVTGLEGATSFDLHFETDLGVVTIQRVVTGGKEESVSSDELVRIAESMPVFAGEAPAPAQTDAVDILQSDNRFITIALSRYRSSVSDIDPDALNPWCTHPDAENIVVPPQQRTSPPVPAYLPQGVSLHNQISHPDGRHYGDTYVSGDGNGDHIRLRVLHSTCLITNSDPALIEQVDIGGNWGVFVTGLEGATSFDLHFETDLGVVTIQRVVTGGAEESVGRDELVRIAESMPVFAGESAAPAQTDAVDILQSDNRFITIALSQYRSSISDIDPDALNPWCTHPDAENIVVPPQQRTSPPVPAYLPQGVSLHNQITHPDGRYYGDTYVSGDGNGDHIRLRVLHSTCLITNSDPALIEQVDVGGNWGVFVTGLEGATSFDLHFETDLGVVTIQRVVTGGAEESVGRDELVRIAESMPVFAGKAAAPAQTDAVDILQSDNRFITIALSQYRSSISDIDPDALNPWCTHPDAENIVVPPRQRTSPPVPAYLPQGVSLHNQITHPDGRYYGDTYVSGDGNGDHIRLRVLHSTCLITNSDPALIEQVDVGGNWGVFVTGLKGATSFDLHFETDLGVVTIQRVVTGGKEESVGRDELVRIAESMPVFDGEAAYRIHRLDASSSADDAQPETGFIISPLGFVKVGIGESVDDVYPPGLHERCISPGPGYPPPISQEAVSPPVPAYLPEGLSLERRSYTPGGTHIGDIYVGIDGARITVRSGACGAVFAPPGLWEPISVVAAWGILVQGTCVVDGDSDIYSVEDGLPDCWKPNAALSLTMETPAGFVEIRSVNVGVNPNSIGKDDLVRIAESMPVFAGTAALID